MTESEWIELVRKAIMQKMFEGIELENKQITQQTAEKFLETVSQTPNHPLKEWLLKRKIAYLRSKGVSTPFTDAYEGWVLKGNPDSVTDFLKTDEGTKFFVKTMQGKDPHLKELSDAEINKKFIPMAASAILKFAAKAATLLYMAHQLDDVEERVHEVMPKTVEWFEKAEVTLLRKVASYTFGQIPVVGKLITALQSADIWKNVANAIGLESFARSQEEYQQWLEQNPDVKQGSIVTDWIKSNIQFSDDDKLQLQKNYDFETLKQQMQPMNNRYAETYLLTDAQKQEYNKRFKEQIEAEMHSALTSRSPTDTSYLRGMRDRLVKEIIQETLDGKFNQ